jgi:ABC-type phosphate/phosphonate transport system substrate-binding protein
VFLVVFGAGLRLRRTAETTGEPVVRMLFVPSVEQGTLARRGNELADFVRKDSGIVIKSSVPTSYAAVIQALGTGQADIAWVPAFAYVVANARFGAEARLQVVRQAERYAIVVTRKADPAENLAGLAGQPIAVSKGLSSDLRKRILEILGKEAPGFKEVSAESDKDAVRVLMDSEAVRGAVSSHVFTGPHDLVGNGRNELEYDRPGTLEKTRILYQTQEPSRELVTAYFGAIYARTDSGIRRLEDLNGRPFAFSDATSTSGYIFPLNLLKKNNIKLGQVLFAGGHPNVIQAVSDGKVAGGSAFYSPPGRVNAVEKTFVADARHLLMKRLASESEKLRFLEEIRVVALTDPVPNDFCTVRRGFSKAIWDRFEKSLFRFLETPDGQSAYLDLVAAVTARRCDDASLDGFRSALKTAGISAISLMEAEEEKLKKKREAQQKGTGAK